MASYAHQWLFVIAALVFSSSVAAQSDVLCSCDACDNNDDVTDHVFELQERVTCLEMSMNQLQQYQDQPRYIRDCGEVSEEGDGGVHQIQPGGASLPFNVTCMFDGDGRWTVLQHRVNGNTDFYRSWAEYRSGFGTNGINNNLWLGLEHMHLITDQRQYTLRIDLIDWNDITEYAEYKFFSIGDEASGYQLYINGHSGSLQDKFGAGHNLSGMKFSTADRDNDRNSGSCANIYPSGWWHNSCYHMNLNGQYHTAPNNVASPNGIQWYQSRGGAWYSWKASIMRIRPTFDN